MKKLSRLLILVAVLLFTATSFQGCKKEYLNKAPATITPGYKSSIPYSDISKINGILHFKDMLTLRKTLDTLERQQYIWDSTFVANYSHLSIDSLNAFEEDTGFNYLQPFVDFENYFNFTSVRSIIEDDLEDWLGNPVLVDSTDPENYFIDDKYVRTVLNEYNELMIDTSIYIMRDDGSTLEIIDSSFATLQLIRDDRIDVDTASNIIIHFPNSASGTCITRTEKGFQESTCGNYRIKWKCYVQNYVVVGIAAAKTISYKKKGNRWKKHRTYIISKVYGKVTNGQCTQDTTIDKTEIQTTKSLACRIKFWNNAIKTERNYMKSYHFASNISKHYSLTW